MVDSFGNVVSCPKYLGNGKRFLNEYFIMKPKINRYGYSEVSLYKDGQYQTKLVHRLVAENLIPNPKKLPVVNHKNGIKSDNRLENLEWCTYQENTAHAIKNNIGGMRDKCIANLGKIRKKTLYTKIVLVGADGIEHEFKSAKEAGKFCGKSNDAVTSAFRKGQRVAGYKVFAECIKANGEA